VVWRGLIPSSEAPRCRYERVGRLDRSVRGPTPRGSTSFEIHVLIADALIPRLAKDQAKRAGYAEFLWENPNYLGCLGLLDNCVVPIGHLERDVALVARIGLKPDLTRPKFAESEFELFDRRPPPQQAEGPRDPDRCVGCVEIQLESRRLNQTDDVRKYSQRDSNPCCRRERAES
jgi:hypothetical protein